MERAWKDSGDPWSNCKKLSGWGGHETKTQDDYISVWGWFMTLISIRAVSGGLVWHASIIVEVCSLWTQEPKEEIYFALQEISWKSDSFRLVWEWPGEREGGREWNHLQRLARFDV